MQFTESNGLTEIAGQLIDDTAYKLAFKLQLFVAGERQSGTVLALVSNTAIEDAVVELHVATRTHAQQRQRPRKTSAVLAGLGHGKVKGKVCPYSLPSVGPGADPGVQAVSPQVT